MFALVDPSGQYYERAQREREDLAKGGWAIALASITLLETHRLIVQNLGVRRARTWLTEAARSFETVVPVADDYNAAVAVALRYADQDLTLFDTLLYVLSQQLSAPIWTYDHHFDILRAARWQP